MAPLSPSAFAERYSVDPQLTEDAFSRLASGEVIALAVSGKFGSGKDTVAPPVVAALGHADDALHEFFAKPLKDEMNNVIDLVRSAEAQGVAIRAVAASQQVSIADATAVVTRLWDDVKNGAVQNSKDRTDASRFALQYWGTDVRRTQDQNYWVKIAINETLQKLSAGNSVFVTDARFPNEIDSLADLGAATVRLKVSPEVQESRIVSRDGIVPTVEARNHISETALDEYERLGKFTVIVDTDFLDKDQVVEQVFAGIKGL